MGSRWLGLHRAVLCLSLDDPLQADHLNHDPLDNRRANLRAVTETENKQNLLAKPGSSSRYRGVTWDKGKRKWKAQATQETAEGHRVYNLGRFVIEREAAEAADRWRHENMPGALPDPALQEAV